MSKSTATTTQPKARTRQELSPDLSEVLHMLKSLENQKPVGGSAQ